jgi:hypothetical protein
MFGYAPQESDQSGRIIAQGMMGAAQTNAQTMGQVGQDIGGALAGIGQMYGAIEERKAKGRAFKKTMEVMGPALGMTTDKLQAAFGDVKTDMDYANLSDSLMPIMPSWINSTLAGQRMDVQQDQQQLTARMPDLRNQATNTAMVTGQGGPSIMGATRRIGAPTGP